MTVADATPDYEVGTHDDRAFLGHPKGLGYLGFTEACERFSYYSMQTLLVLYMVNYLLLPGRMEQCHRPRLAAGARLSRHFGPAARLGDLRHLHRAGLPHADPRRDHRRQLARPEHDADHRRRADGDRPFPDGDRVGIPLRAARARARRRRFQGQYRDPGRRALRPERSPPRDGVPDLLHLHQRQRDRRAADLGHARAEGRLALRLRLRRRGDGARPVHLSVGPPLPCRAEELAQPERGAGASRAAHPRRLVCACSTSSS